MFFLYLLAILTGSFLLFVVQPMLGKVLLPFAGGAPAVWIAAMLFFQLLVLVGYGYASLSSAFLTARRQSLFHIGLMIFAALPALPLSLRMWHNVEEVAPEYWVIGSLLGTVGIPYVLLSANATLLQRWYFEVKGTSPYFLFSISNIGSLLGLLCYPLLIEWLLPLKQQMFYWSFLFYALIAVLGAITLRMPRNNPSGESSGLGKNLPFSHIRRIVFYGFIPSSLFLSTTLFITTDIASMPLLWVIPLALYLLSFVVVFSRQAEWWIRIAQYLHLPACALVSLFACYVFIFSGTFAASNKFLLQIGIHLFCFFVIAVSCHGQAAKEKPAPEYLTSYYFWLSVGGALGGLFNTLSPHLFNDVYEYPIVLLLSLVVLPLKQWFDSWRQLTNVRKISSVGASSVLVFSLLVILVKGEGDPVLYKERNFFGVKRVIDRAPPYPRRDLRLGNTLQGYQPVLPEYRLSFVSYYQPLEVLLHQAPDGFFEAPFAILGLGAGTLACAAKPGQKVDFFEIDPQVIDIAQEPSFFTYLRDCPAESHIIFGDGRQKIAAEPQGKYQLIVIDVFTSNAIPVHLLTREAVGIYLDKLDKEQGLLAFNISNRHVDLRGVLAGIAAHYSLNAYYQYYEDSPDAPYDAGAAWVIMAEWRSPWRPVLEAQGFESLAADNKAPLWTDDYSSIFGVLK